MADTILSFFNTEDSQRDRGNGNGNGDDYKTQIDSQLSRLMTNRIPMDQLRNYRDKNNKITSGLNEIINIIDESKEHFDVFKRKIGILKQKTSSGEGAVKDAERLIDQQERVDQLCAEQNRRIQECESEKQRLQAQLSSKLSDDGRKDAEIRQLTEQIKSLQKKQSESVFSITSANEELIKYNKSLVDKIKNIADTQGRIIQELDNELGQGGSEVESKINSIKEKLIGLVDSIDDENNGLGPPQVYRNGRNDRQLPLRPIFQEPIAKPEQKQRDVLVQQQFRGGPFREPLFQPRERRVGFEGGKHKKTRKSLKSLKRGGKGKKHMRMFKTRSRK